ncbi:MAG: enolase C-terminal domain-like protein [Candidatus Avoscillospira sp.]
MMERKLYCGAGKEKITPPPELLVKLPGLMGGHFSGKIYDDLFVRAVCFRNEENTVLFVEFDMDKAPSPVENMAAIEERFGIGQDNILFFGVHTHTAPLSSERPFEKMNSLEAKTPEEQAAMRRFDGLVREKMLQAVQTAFDTLQEAKIGWATGESHINVNRCQSYLVEQPDGTVHPCCALGANPAGPVDHTLFVLKAETLGGEPMLSLMPDAKLHLGGNATAAVSAAVLKAGANVLGIPLYRHIGGANAMYLPVPGVAMAAGHERYGGGITTPGGKPTMSCMCFGFDTFAEASYACWDIHTRWSEKMKKLFEGTPNIRDFIVIPEGIFKSDEEIWEAMTETVIQAGYEGKVGFQMDIATDTYHNKEDGKYYCLFNREPKTKDQLYDFYMQMIRKFPFVILEDPFNEDDYETTAAFTKDSGIQIVGDDLFTTNPTRVEYGISKGAANTILLKVNQIGTITEALQMIQYAYKFGYAVMPSDSRGEGDAIGDYAVGINAGSIRESGIGPRGNRLLEIEEELGPRAQFIGAKGLKCFRNQARAAELKKEE